MPAQDCVVLSCSATSPAPRCRRNDDESLDDRTSRDVVHFRRTMRIHSGRRLTSPRFVLSGRAVLRCCAESRLTERRVRHLQLLRIQSGVNGLQAAACDGPLAARRDDIHNMATHGRFPRHSLSYILLLKRTKILANCINNPDRNLSWHMLCCSIRKAIF